MSLTSSWSSHIGRVTRLHVQNTGFIFSFSFKIALWYTFPLFIVKTF